MIEEYSIDRFNLRLSRNASSQTILYMNWPEGLRNDVLVWMEQASRKYNTNIVAISGLDWNNDMTPWPGDGVFKKAKPFGGKAEDYLEILTHVLLPEIENKLSPTPLKRILIGVSLSGLFSLWAGLKCNYFQKIGIISGSLWYDGLEEWIRDESNRKDFYKPEEIYCVLGDREKNSKNERIARVEEISLSISDTLKEEGYNISLDLFEGTHFSPIIPRLEVVLEKLTSRE